MSPIVRPRRGAANGAREAEAGLSRSRLRQLSTAAIVAVVAVILLTTLTPAGVSASGCALGLPCVVGHLGLFGLLGAALAGRYATSAAAAESPRRVLMMTVLAVWIFAAADELAQNIVEGREASLVDWLADMVGALGGMLAGSVVLRRILEASRR